MATHRSAGRPFDRRFGYLLLAALIVGPLLAFAIGPLTSDSFGLRGPGGPLLAFSAGVLSFVSPCVLPLVPIYISHLSGATIEGGRIVADRRVTFTHAVAFVGGLSAVFIVLGTSVALLGSYFFRDNQREMEQIAGFVLIAMGILLVPEHGKHNSLRSALVLLGLTAAYFFIAEVADLRDDRRGLLELAIALGLAWFRYSGYLPLPFFSRTFEVNVGRNRPVGYGRSALVGGSFALGWTPCIGPILGSILTITTTETASTGDALTGTYLLVAYSVGFAVPFLITGLALGDATKVLRKIQPYTPIVEVVSAVVIIGLGLLLWYGSVTGLYDFFSFAEFNQGL